MNSNPYLFAFLLMYLMWTCIRLGKALYNRKLKRFLTHLCDTNVIDCHSAEEIVKKWEEWGK